MFFFLSVVSIFYSNNVQNIEARWINLFCQTGYSCRIYETLVFWYSKHLSSGAVDHWKNNEIWHSLKVKVKISFVSFLSGKYNYPHNIKCLRKVEFYMRIGYSSKWNSMRIWHFKLRNICRYAAYLGHCLGWVIPIISYKIK